MSIVSLSTEVILSNSLGSYSVFASDLARWPNFAMQVRSGACPALLGRESTAGSCGCRSQGRGRDWSRSGRAGTAETGES